MVTAASVIKDMKANEISLPGGNPGAGWYRGGAVVLGADWRGQAAPTYWNSANKFYGYWNGFIPWYVCWDGPGHVGGLNTRLYIYQPEAFLLMNGQWTQVSMGNGLGGEAFARNLVDFSGAGDQRSEPNGISIRIQPGSQAVFHGWGQFASVNGSQVRGVHVRMRMRLIKHDANGVDDRHLAVYGMQTGGDAYVYSGQNVGEFAPAYYAPGIGFSGFMRASNDERVVCLTNLDTAHEVEYGSLGGKQSYFVMSEAAFLSNLPPGVTLADAPAPIPSQNTQKKILPVGDSFTKGIEGVSDGFRSPRGRIYNRLISDGRSVDFIGPESDTPAVGGDANHAGYGGAYLAAGSNSGNNLYDRMSSYLSSTYQPDLIVVWAGWNGVYNETTPQDKYQTWINAMKEARPNAKFVLGTLPPTRGETQAQSNTSTPGYEALNTRIRQLCAGDPTRLFLADCASVTLTSADYWDVIHLLQTGIDKVYGKFMDAINAALYAGTTPTIPQPVGRKEIWISGNATGSAQDGTRANPINTLTALRAAIQTYGPTGIDVRKMESSIWTGVFADELFHYNGSTLKGNDWLSDPGYFEGGVRKTDWTTVSGASAGYQLWKCSSMTYQSPTTSMLQPGSLSVDDAVIASRTFTTLAPTIAAMEEFERAFSYDLTNNIVYLLLPTGENPNTLTTMVGQTSECLRNYAFASAGNKRTGIILQHLRFKRYSGFPVNLANLPGVQIKNLYGKHIGGRYRPTPEGKFIELYGGCDNFIVEDIRCDGIDQAVFSSQVRSGFAQQNGGTVRRVSGTHIGRAVVDYQTQVADGGVMDGHLIEDISGTSIGDYLTTALRPDVGGVGLFSMSAGQGPGTSSINNLVLRRAVAVDSPVGSIDIGYETAGRSVFLEACQGKANAALNIPHGIAFSHTASGTGSDFYAFRACAFEGYESGIKNAGGQHSFAVEVTNCGFDNLDVAGIDMNGVANTTLTIQNNVGHDATLLVRAINGPGSSCTNEGGNYVSTGTTLGVTAVGTDDTGAADPAFVGNSVAKPPDGSALYSGGVALNITLKDRLGGTFDSPWAQGPYAEYNSSDGSTGTSPPPVGSQDGLSVWEAKYVTGSTLAWYAEQSGDSTVSGIQGIPSTLSLILNQSYSLSPTVTGTGEYSGAVTYSIVSGSSVTVSTAGVVKATSIGTTVVRVASTQVPTVFVNLTVIVSNYTEAPITATPSSLALTLVGGAGTVVISADGKVQAGLSALSNNSAIATAAAKTKFDGSLAITPVAVGSCVVLVTKTSRFGGDRTIEIPVTVTEGTVAGDVTEINTDGDSIDDDGNHFVEIDDSPYFIALEDQNGEAITGFDHVVTVKLSRPAYIRAPHTVIDGTLPIYPQGVGFTTVLLELHDETAGKVTHTFTVEVGPVGGSSTPPSAPPPPISPTDPDPTTVDGDFVFTVDAE